MPDNTFDVVSKIELPEVLNAVQQALKEVTQRYDLKDSHSNIELNEKDNKILLASKDEFKLKAVVDILQSKLVKRHVPLKGLSYGEIIPSAGSTVKQEINLQQGITTEKAREIVKTIKDAKLKVQASIQGDFVRVSAVVCHPHPLYGGTLHNKVVHRIARALRDSGAVVLRFNFRQAGIPEGLEDARAALAWLRARYPDLPYALAGFSFGARVITELGCAEAAAARFLLAVGFSPRLGNFEYLETCASPRFS